MVGYIDPTTELAHPPPPPETTSPDRQEADAFDGALAVRIVQEREGAAQVTLLLLTAVTNCPPGQFVVKAVPPNWAPQIFIPPGLPTGPPKR